MNLYDDTALLIAAVAYRLGEFRRDKDVDVARAVLDAVAGRIAARALRQAADDIETDLAADSLCHSDRWQFWLRARADVVEGTQPTEVSD